LTTYPKGNIKNSYIFTVDTILLYLQGYLGLAMAIGYNKSYAAFGLKICHRASQDIYCRPNGPAKDF